MYLTQQHKNTKFINEHVCNWKKKYIVDPLYSFTSKQKKI